MTEFRLVSTVPDEEFHRAQAAAKRARLADRAGGSLMCLAVNVLRVVRGAGRPQDIIRQLSHAIEVMADYREAMGHALPASDIATYLRMPTGDDRTRESLAEGRITDAHVARCCVERSM